MAGYIRRANRAQFQLDRCRAAACSGTEERGAGDMRHGAWAAEGSFQNGRLLGPTGQLNAPIALWPLTQIANCQLQLAPPRRSIDRSIVASMPRSPLCLRLPCSALGHVLQTFCCRLLKVISLLRAAFLPLSLLCSDSIWFLWLHVDAFSLHVFMSCRKVAARLRCWAAQRAAGRRGGCICCSICGSLSAI